jgi:plastocyanin
MLLRPGVTLAVLAITLTVGGVALAANQSVTARSNPADEFSPVNVTINQGETVTWTNGGGLHNVKFDDGSFEMPPAPSNSSWTVQRTFNTPGSFHYVCVQHAPGMAGTVTVIATGAPESPGGSPPGGSPPGGSPPGASPPTEGPTPTLPLLKVTLKVSDATPLAGERVRVFGVVRPARDGRKLQIQKRARNGRYVTVATTRLRDAGAAKSQFSVLLRVSGDGVFRARVAGDEDRGAGLSKTKKVDVQRPRGG